MRGLIEQWRSSRAHVAGGRTRARLSALAVGCLSLMLAPARDLRRMAEATVRLVQDVERDEDEYHGVGERRQDLGPVVTVGSGL